MWKMRALLGVLLALGLQVTAASAQEQHIHVNGEHLTAEQINYLQQSVGYAIPDGYYWIDFETGMWGYQDHAESEGSIYLDGSGAAATSGAEGGTGSQGSGDGTQIYNWGDGGYVQGEDCSYASVGGTTVRLCD